MLSSIMTSSLEQNNTKDDDHHELLTFYVSHLLLLHYDIPDSICLEIMGYLKTSSVPLDEYYGHWDWKHNGFNTNGTITICPGGIIKGGGGTRHMRNWGFERGFLMVYGYAQCWMKLSEVEGRKQLTLYYPIRSPKTIATFNRELNELEATSFGGISNVIEMKEDDMIGTWWWCHDGSTVNGSIVLEKGGNVTSFTGDWSGQRWYLYDDVLFVRFNNIDHAMVWENEECKRLILLAPKREPQSTAYLMQYNA